MNKQKKLLKVTSFLLLFSLSATLQPISASAAETNGTLPDCDIQWSYSDETDTLTLTGDGDSVLTEIGIDPLWNPISTIEVQGIAQINCKLTADTIILGKEVRDFITPSTSELDGVPYANICYIVDPENPYYTCYDDALYTKDLTELIHVPPLKTEIDFPDTLEKIDSYAFLFTVLDEIVVPWGVTTIEDYGVEFLSPRAERNEYMYVILPDTLQSIGESDRYTMCRFAYSGNNSAISTSRLYPMLSTQALQICQEVIKLYGKSSLYDFYGITSNSFKTFGSKTYYFDADCKMVTGRQMIDGKIYTFDQNGVLQKESEPASVSGLVYQDGKAYIYDEDGNMLRSGWYQADGNWYYLNDYGAGVVSCWRLKDGKYVYLGADGKMQTNCWVEDYSDWYYVKADGTRYESAWAKIGGSWYWFGGSGKMMSNGWLKLDGKWYYFRSGGQMATGWIKDGSKWYYLNGSGAMAANKWVKSGSYWYYLGSDGAMLTNTTTPDGYHVDSEGRWV